MFLHKWLQIGDEKRLAWIHPDDRDRVLKHFSDVTHLRPDQVHDGALVYCL
ncbi:hypothetical protein [Desulfosarcina ovata]|uniref:Uncharacterized protein n=1 Tax=Desulfosarcina ovata subsp. ovata TaxID=2752305 RepID=A0A5K8A4K5_9BACT|nr:hypothetical protein [Desulfosarcina ovata]BBO87284.1 hypothetical protein DSCOOX_04640 [Desulfosarcina ovata subsp. ovata]